ncbi:MAG: DEAD/DEAH box helicase [Candidatus Krumholzibacteria bacterium]|nr:DEAD/DEAH box helicase [Candidatus Krumholzibacteria bacterium]MDH4336747.1 DEAD/DEAH box helicase [Candidatus Krumholzibacteria bacterium]MDH5270478.1 DEAD/DEAH box helicase [Candidatus Krumholzibacteria bacterium]
MTFEELNLPAPILSAIKDSGYHTPTEIQAQAIPPGLEGRDILGRAATGTGKTAAFAIPILVGLTTNDGNQDAEGAQPPRHPQRKGANARARAVRALVLTPTRELCVQNEEAFKAYGSYLDLRVLAIYGGMPIDRQIKKLHAGVDIVIATPGRLLDHLSRHTIDLRNVEYFVLDEVDRMFDMGFIQDVRRIIAKIPGERQTLLFSATMSSEVRRLAERVQHDAVLVEVGEQRRPTDTVTQYVYPVPRDRKMELLRIILENEDWDMVLVFTGTKDNAEFLTRRLSHNGVDVAELHSNLSQKERRDALEGFKNGEHRVLIATDIAARGLDIDGISHVVNFDVPRNAEDYIHRIGRTGRAEATGDAVTLVSFDEEEFLDRIEEHIGAKLERRRYRDFDHGVGRFTPTRAELGRMHRGSRRSSKRRYV